MAQDLRIHREGGVEHIELHRPDALNAWTPDMGRELLAALQATAADPEVRCVLLTGAGRAFCAGADVKVPREVQPDGALDLHTRLEEIYNPIVLLCRRMQKPVVAGVHGACAGLGFSLAMAADLVVAARSARFLLAFVRLGVIPDGGVLPHLVARIGAGRATQLAMLGEPLDAETALAWGAVTEVVADEELLPRAHALCAELAAGPTVALGSMKEVVNATAALGPLLDVEAQLQQRHATTADYAEGVAAFKEKRAARFTGS